MRTVLADDSGKFNILLPTCQFSPEDFQTDRETFFYEISKFGRGAAIIGEPPATQFYTSAIHKKIYKKGENPEKRDSVKIDRFDIFVYSLFKDALKKHF